jgi:hypothetical protein
VASPAVCEMSKHSMRSSSRSSTGRSSASARARVRACCEPSSASRRASCRAALVCAISSQMRRCSRGWCTALTFTPVCSDSACSSAAHRLAGDQLRRHGHVQVVLGDEGLQHLASTGSGSLRGLLVASSSHPCASSTWAGKVGPVAQVAPAAHHGQVDAGRPPCTLTARMSTSRSRHVVHRLLVQHARQRRIWSRSSAACSNSSARRAPSCGAPASSSTSCVSPRRKRSAWATSWA